MFSLYIVIVLIIGVNGQYHTAQQWYYYCINKSFVQRNKIFNVPLIFFLISYTRYKWLKNQMVCAFF